MPFDDRSTSLDLNGPDIEIKTDAYGHEEGSTTAKTIVNPFGSDDGRTGGTIEITGIGLLLGQQDSVLMLVIQVLLDISGMNLMQVH